MANTEARQGRVRNAQGTREAILNAAEEVFAEHGFDGARFDAIAMVSGYNRSLIGQYFGDKLGLYTEVLKRTDRELNHLLEERVTPLMADEHTMSDAPGFRSFIGSLVRIVFDYLAEHPRFLRILTWEMADGWQIYEKIVPQMIGSEGDLFEPLFTRVRSAGWLRSDFPAALQLTLIFQICQSFLAYLPMYHLVFFREDIHSPEALTQAREGLVTMVVGAMIRDLPGQ